MGASLEHQHHPSRWGSAFHSVKVMGAKARRLLKNALDSDIVRHLQDERPAWPAVAESRSRIWTNDAPGEWELEAGKVENLRRAACMLDGVMIPAGGVFSFWKQIGPTTRRRGFVEGREVLQGCVVPSVGGGICQMSNALYDAALKAGFEIIERHRHSQIIPGSMAQQDRDATVFWPHIDLRFQSKYAFWIEAHLTRDEFIVRFYADAPAADNTASAHGSVMQAPARPTSHQNCLNCSQTDCFRYWQHRELARRPGERSAYLLDSHWPEFDRYVEDNASGEDLACIPLPGRELKNARYAWKLRGVRNVYHTAGVTALRGLHTRTLTAQGAARQRALLEWDQVLAEIFACHLGPRVTRVVVSQNLLPHLWESGHLQGRQVDVLMTRFPISELHRRLDRAAKLHPESPTLGDFRAPPRLTAAEAAALEAANTIITPHNAIAELFPHKSEKIAWELPYTPPLDAEGNLPTKRRPTVVFPASTVGRKGAYELREALDGLQVDLRILGAELEGEHFWSGRSVGSIRADEITGSDLVVLPAHIEHQPRLLLRAAASGVPTIASKACGLADVAGVEEVATGDADALREAIARYLSIPSATFTAA